MFTRLSGFASLGSTALELSNTVFQFLNWQVGENKHYKTLEKAMIQLR